VGLYEDQVLPRAIDLALRGKAIDRMRARVSSGLSGEVLELGFGTGRNLPHLPDGVSVLRIVEPAAVGRALAAGRIAARHIPVEDVGLDGAVLPLPDESVDHVLSTWTLCTIPDVRAALAETARVLRPGGALHFIEHGRAPDAGVARWQDRLTPLQRRLFGGCHLNRPMAALIESSGLHLQDLENFYMQGPKVLSYMYEGRAVKR